MNRFWKAGVITVFMAAAATFGYLAIAERWEADQLLAKCPTGGRFDQIVPERIGTTEGTLVQGWLIAPRGTGGIVFDEDKTWVALHPSEERLDVQGAFPECRGAALTHDFCY